MKDNLREMQNLSIKTGLTMFVKAGGSFIISHIHHPTVYGFTMTNTPFGYIDKKQIKTKNVKLAYKAIKDRDLQLDMILDGEEYYIVVWSNGKGEYIKATEEDLKCKRLML